MKKFLRTFALPVLAAIIQFLLWALDGVLPQHEKDEIRQLLEEGKRA